MKQQIKNRYSDAVIFECEVPDTVSSGMAMRHALEKAVQSGANLGGANLRGAYLRGAYLGGAYLGGADLGGADLGGANLGGANLGGANLGGANLGGANLRGANLRGADLGGAYLGGANLRDAYLGEDRKLIGDRPFFQLGPIGSRSDYFQSFITDKGLFVSAGCFKYKTVDEFREKLATEHADNDHAKEYEMALLMIEAHAAIWTPKENK